MLTLSNMSKVISSLPSTSTSMSIQTDQHITITIVTIEQI